MLNASKLYDELKQQGYEGSRSHLRAFVRPFRTVRQTQATVRFETEPGGQAQVDWGHFDYINHRGHQRRLYAYVMTLGWSRAMYVEFTVSADWASTPPSSARSWSRPVALPGKNTPMCVPST